VTFAALILAAAISAQGTQAVNVPYPLSPEEAARDFLRAVDDLKPRPWTGTAVGGPGPFLAAGVLQCKTRTADGATVFMVRLPTNEALLVRSDSYLPELALNQRTYMLMDLGESGDFSVPRLTGIVLACDLGAKSEVLDLMLGLKKPSPSLEEQKGGTTSGAEVPAAATSASKGASGVPAAPGVQWQGYSAGLGQQQFQPASTSPQVAALQNVRAANRSVPTIPPFVVPVNPAALPSANVLPTPPTVLQLVPGSGTAKLGTEPLPTDFAEEQRVAFWKEWIAKHNPNRTEAEREAIVRWVLYYSAYYGVDHRLIFAVMKYESNFDPGCVSHAGAIGLMQLMPETARGLGVDPWVVEDNIKGGIQELAGYLDEYAGRSNYEQCALALACYNAGPNRVKRAGGIPDITETKNYVRRVTELFYELVKSGAP
jgi:soluble lytic murein transglycosylase-like protein